MTTSVPEEVCHELPGAHYSLVCTRCGLRTDDDGLRLRCPDCHDGALLRTEYRAGAFTVTPAASGIFRYRDWLPVRREVPGSSRPAVYRSQGLGSALGLRDLWISFSGYWPERDCHMTSGTFKELEAYTVLGRLPRRAGVMVVASAGNTAAAFASASRFLEFPCVLVVPDRSLPVLASAGPVPGNVNVVGLEGATYNDAIRFGEEIVAAAPGFFAEGGVRNVGRRDGLAVVTLTAYEEMGSLPDFYFQAVGSGAGAIATYEASRRIAGSGTGGHTVPRLFLCQNAEFAPLHRAWNERRTARPDPAAQGRVYAPELVNAAPPFTVHGGVKHILEDSSGDVLVADHGSAASAAAMFEELEGIDIAPAAAVAVACLRRAVADRRIPRDARVLLNVTGGGRQRRLAAAADGARDSEAWLAGRGSSPDVVASEILRAVRARGQSAAPSLVSARP